MSIVVNATADIAGRTANLPSYTSFTQCGWARVLSDQGAGTNQPLCVPVSAGLTDAVGIYWDSTTSAGSMRIFTAVGGAETSGTAFASRPAVGTDFFWYMRCSGTGAGLLQGGWRAAGSNTFVQATATLSGGPAAPANWRLANVPGFFYLDSKHWNSKCWDRVLTDAELMVESFYSRLMFPSSINWHWPLKNASDTRDLGGLGRAPTFGGTITTDDEYGLYAPRRRVFVPVAAAGAAIYTRKPFDSPIFQSRVIQ